MHRLGLARLMPDQLLGHGPFVEGSGARQNKIERRSETVDIGANVDAVAVERLLGRQVVGGAEHILVVLFGKNVILVMEEASQAHVEDFDDAASIDQDVAGLDVAVDDAAGLMGMVQADGRLPNVMCGSGDVHRPMFLDDLLQAGAVHIFHHQKVQLVVLIDVISANDVGMIQSRDGAGFPIETFERRRVLGFSGGQDLDGGATAHELVLAQIDTAHAALAKALHHFVLADREAPPAALKKLFGLEMGENAIADQNAGQLARFLGRGAGRAELGHGRVQPLVVHDPAFLGEVNQFFHRRRRRHAATFP